MKPWRRKRALDARVEQAHAEVELSRERLEETRRTVVAPLKAKGERNQFADLIRASLVTGHRGRAHE